MFKSHVQGARMAPPTASRLPACLLAGLLLAAPLSAQSRPVPPAPFLGGLPTGTVAPAPIAITILDAINRGIERNLGLFLANEAVERARSSQGTARAELLPDISGRLAETRQLLNLEAFGFPLPSGFPSLVGPFNVFDARLRVSQSVFDLGAIQDVRAERHNVAAARHTVKGARDLVVLITANAYLQALAASARTASAQAQMESAEAIFRQASNMKDAGLVAGIDVLRADVQLATERQRVTAARNEFEKAKLQLARLMGLPLGQAFTLVDELPFVPAPDLSLDAALEQAYATRPDYLAALERVQAAEAERRSAQAGLLPTVQVNADYGALGLTAGDAHATYAIAGAVTIPLFDGARTRARILEAETDVRSRRAEADELKTSIYYDVRTAFLELQATREQLDVADRARDLSTQQLAQARDRFAAGVTSNIEVVQAQEAVATSSEQYISALYGYNVAKALLARGLGVAESAARQYFGGVR